MGYLLTQISIASAEKPLQGARPCRVLAQVGRSPVPGAAREGGHPTFGLEVKERRGLCGLVVPVLAQRRELVAQSIQPISLLTQEPPVDGGIELDDIGKGPEGAEERLII